MAVRAGVGRQYTVAAELRVDGERGTVTVRASHPDLGDAVARIRVR